MRFIRIAGLCLVALAAMAMATAATASAAPVWELNGAEVKGTEKVMASATLRLFDTKTAAGESEVECSGTTTGTIGPGKFDRVESVTVSSCKAVKVCETSFEPKAKAVNLPWQTELFETEGKVRNKITEVAGKGEPGWAVTCKVIIEKTDTCTTETGKEGSTLETNEATHGYVLGAFERKTSGKAKCSEGGKESGEVEGIVTTLSEPTGSPIRVS
jgi:hypothetical protein